MDVGAGIFLGVQRNFAWILPNLPDKYFKISDLKKTFSCQFGRHYFQIKTCWAPFLHRFSGCFRRFLGILSGFYRILPKFSPNQNFWGLWLHLLHSRLLHQCIILLIFFSLLTLQCKWAFIKHFAVSTPQRKCPIEARAPFPSILKCFSSGAVYEFSTKVFLLSSVTVFAELLHKCRYHC